MVLLIVTEQADELTGKRSSFGVNSRSECGLCHGAVDEEFRAEFQKRFEKPDESS